MARTFYFRTTAAWSPYKPKYFSVQFWQWHLNTDSTVEIISIYYYYHGTSSWFLSYSHMLLKPDTWDSDQQSHFEILVIKKWQIVSIKVTIIVTYTAGIPWTCIGVGWVIPLFFSVLKTARGNFISCDISNGKDRLHSHTNDNYKWSIPETYQKNFTNVKKVFNIYTDLESLDWWWYVLSLNYDMPFLP